MVQCVHEVFKLTPETIMASAVTPLDTHRVISSLTRHAVFKTSFGNVGRMG